MQLLCFHVLKIWDMVNFKLKNRGREYTIHKQVNYIKHRSAKWQYGKREQSRRLKLREERRKSRYLVKWKERLKGICNQVKQRQRKNMSIYMYISFSLVHGTTWIVEKKSHGMIKVLLLAISIYRCNNVAFCHSCDRD